MPDTELELRRLLALTYSGMDLYHDDGELQDNAKLPQIDFLRDSPTTIRHKIQERTYKQAKQLRRL